MAQQIWLWCMPRDIWLSACHIPGSANVDVDNESRRFNSSTEWSLHSDVFADINEMWVHFKLTFLHPDLILRLPIMCHGNQTLVHII